jgi:hypothetical protein
MKSSMCAAPCVKVSHGASGDTVCPRRPHYTRYYAVHGPQHQPAGQDADPAWLRGATLSCAADLGLGQPMEHCTVATSRMKNGLPGAAYYPIEQV